MSFYYNKTIKGQFDEVISKITENLKQEGFGVLTQIDVTQTLKNKLNVEFRKYRILGACNPPFAYKALQIEDKIGLMLPCNIIVQEKTADAIEVASINPLMSMQVVGNPELEIVATEIQSRLHRVIDLL
jgi:uncharacterized protein (DUF302 family)